MSIRTDYDAWPWRGHREQAREDAQYGRKNRHLYDRWGGQNKRAYAEEYDIETRRIEARRREEREEEERAERRAEERREEQRRYDRYIESQREAEEQEQIEHEEPEE